MLKIMRQKNVTKFVLWGILILILPAFVLWGTGSGGRPKDKGPTYAGMIDNKKVSFEDFAGSVSAIKCQIILNYFNQPKVLQTFLSSRPFLGKMAWDRLLMIKEAKKYGIKASDADIVKHIRSHPIFLRNGVFDPKVYEYVLRYNMGLEPRTFEEMMRQNLQIQQLNAMLTKDVKISDEEIVQSYRKDNEKFKLIFTIFSADNFMDKVKIEEAGIKDYYEKHKEEFTLPPKEGESAAPQAVASFDEVKDNIKRFLSEAQARTLAVKYAEEEYLKINDALVKDNLSFEEAAEKLGLKLQQTPYFVKTEYLEGVGEGLPLVEKAVKMEKNGVSGLIEVRKGAVVFKLVDFEKYDEEKFKKEKEEFSKTVLENKKMLSLEGWLRGLEEANKPVIDFKEYDKYYR